MAYGISSTVLIIALKVFDMSYILSGSTDSNTADNLATVHVVVAAFRSGGFDNVRSQIPANIP